MRKRLLLYIAACFYYSGLVALARWWEADLGRGSSFSTITAL